MPPLFCPEEIRLFPWVHSNAGAAIYLHGQEATWARGYGLMLGFSAAALLCWQLASDGVRKKWTIGGLAVSIACAVSCHYYALYVPGALVVGEIVKIFERKKADVFIGVAIAVGAGPLLAYVSLLRSVSPASRAFWIKPMVRFLYESYADLFGPAAVVLLLGLALVVGRLD